MGTRRWGRGQLRRIRRRSCWGSAELAGEDGLLPSAGSPQIYATAVTCGRSGPTGRKDHPQAGREGGLSSARGSPPIHATAVTRGRNTPAMEFAEWGRSCAVVSGQLGRVRRRVCWGRRSMAAEDRLPRGPQAIGLPEACDGGAGKDVGSGTVLRELLRRAIASFRLAG